VRAREEDCPRPDGTMAKAPGNYGLSEVIVSSDALVPATEI
jgi:hypothetical protein